MNAGDLIVLSTLGLFAIFGLLLGFVGVVLLVARWAGASLITFWGLPYAQAAAHSLIENALIANVLGGIVLFVVALIILSIISHAIGNLVRHSSLNALDRTLGFVVGIAGGVAVIALSYLAFNQWIWTTPTDRPEWVRQARTLPLVEATANVLRGLAPPEYRGQVQAIENDVLRKSQQAEQAQRALRALGTPTANPPATEKEKGYKVDARRELERLIQTNQLPESRTTR